MMSLYKRNTQAQHEADTHRKVVPLQDSRCYGYDLRIGSPYYKPIPEPPNGINVFKQNAERKEEIVQIFQDKLEKFEKQRFECSDAQLPILETNIETLKRKIKFAKNL